MDENTGMSALAIIESPDEKKQPRIEVREGRGKVVRKHLLPSGAHLMVEDGQNIAADDVLPALMWQPRAIGGLVLVGLVLQAWPYFLGLSALLWWNVVLPHLNLFDALYNRLRAKPRGLPRLGPAPSPRRFAQAMAGSDMLAIGLSLLSGWCSLAWALEAFLVVALGALIFGRFCLLVSPLHGAGSVCEPNASVVSCRVGSLA